MARTDTNAAWLACIGLLLAALASEFLFGEPGILPTPPAPAFAARAAHTFHAVAPPRRTAEYAAVVLARPLFSSHRRPPVSSSRPGAAASASLPRLSGIIVAGALRRALFDLDGKPLAGSAGDHVGAYEILAIAPRQVTVTGPAGLQTLSLRFGAPQAAPSSGPSILDRLRGQRYRPPPLPSSAALNQLLLRPPQALTR